MQNQTIVQGKLELSRIRGSQGYVGLVIPFDNPGEWFFQPLPTLELAQHYAAENNLVIVNLENVDGTQNPTGD